MRKILKVFVFVFSIITATSYAATSPQGVSIAPIPVPVPVPVQTSNQTAPTNESLVDLTNRITILENNTAAIQMQISTLGQRLNSIEQTVQQLKQSQDASFTQWLQTTAGEHYFFVFAGAIVLVLLLFIMMHLGIWHKNIKQTAAAKSSQTTVSSEEDFDLMSASEGMPAKLHLARAYIEMGNNEMAKKLLQEVISGNDSSLKDEAQKLLEQVKE